ncbi:MAG TPA: cell division protein FtsA [Patescibacteria group bacterium]|nr:cell division protein FtsA [Patescibacteria group bacterium]
MDSEFVVGLDAGTTMVSVVIGEVGRAGAIKIVGVGSSESEGMKKGVVVNIEEAAACVSRATREAEKMAGVEIQGVCASLSSPDIKSFNSRGVVALSPGTHEIMEGDVERVTAISQNVTLPADREVIQAVGQDYIVDTHGGIRDPIGMAATRLGAEMHIVTGLAMPLENFSKVLRKAGLVIVNLVFEPIASALAVCTADERENGCLVIDVGGGVTSYMLYHGGCVRSSGVIPAGGINITNDLAIGLRLPFPAAEELKRSHGIALASMAGEDEEVVLPGIENRGSGKIRAQMIAAVIEPRCEELFTMVKEAVSTDRQIPVLGGGVVLTGGASQVRGLTGVAEQVFDLPVRCGRPSNLEGLAEIVSDPSFSTVIGLLIHERDSLPRDSGREAGMLGRLKSIAEKLKSVASWS